MTRLLFVGEAGAPGDEPLAGRCGARLAGLLLLTLDEFLAQHDRRNVLPYTPERQGKGRSFPLEDARIFANVLRPELRCRRVVLLGHRVAAAFRRRVPYLTAVELAGSAALALPHPSSVNRWWNDPANVRRASDTLRLFLFDEDPLKRHR